MDNIRKKKLQAFLKNIDSRVAESIDFIDSKFQNQVEFNYCLDFSNIVLNSIKSTSERGVYIRFFSAMEVKAELENSLNLASICVYKSAFDSLRRALEISVLGCYYELFNDENNEMFDWVYSKIRTPSFDKMIKILSNSEGYSPIAKSDINWKSEISNLYWDLSGYLHTRGKDKSIHTINSTDNSFYRSPIFNEQSLIDYLNKYILVVKMIAITTTIANPILLIGLPVHEKFGSTIGLNIGLFDERKSEILNNIIPVNYKTVLLKIIQSDESIRNRIDNIKGMSVSDSFIRIMKIFDQMQEIISPPNL